ncbi:MAG: methylamine utilization protein, partial [Verrucomicrobia bacterium]|nr:methylamine utilization protein [Verrucomicrobiota bacterium]
GCNIHDWMLAYLIVLPTPWFAKSDATGHAAPDAPAGSYRLEIWHPRLAAPVTREVSLPATGDTASPLAFTLALKPDRRIRRAPDAKGGGYK